MNPITVLLFVGLRKVAVIQPQLTCGVCDTLFKNVQSPDRRNILEYECGSDIVKALNQFCILVATRSSSERVVPNLERNYLITAFLNLMRNHWKYGAYFVFAYNNDEYGDIRGVNFTRLMDGSTDKPIPDEVLFAQEEYPWIQFNHYNGGPVAWSTSRLAMCVVNIACLPPHMRTNECASNETETAPSSIRPPSPTTSSTTPVSDTNTDTIPDDSGKIKYTYSHHLGLVDNMVERLENNEMIIVDTRMNSVTETDDTSNSYPDNATEKATSRNVPDSDDRCLVIARLSTMLQFLETCKHLFLIAVLTNQQSKMDNESFEDTEPSDPSSIQGTLVTVYSFSGYGQWNRMQLLNEMKKLSWNVVPALIGVNTLPYNTSVPVSVHVSVPPEDGNSSSSIASTVPHMGYWQVLNGVSVCVSPVSPTINQI